MKTMQDQVREALELPREAIDVKRIGIGRLILTVVDPSFETMTEFERQSKVWDALEAKGVATTGIDLLMTNTPGEDKALREQRANETDEPEGGYAEAL